MERRWCERIPLNAEAYVFHSGRYIPVELRNVSLEGALVDLGSEAFEANDNQVELIIEDGGKVTIPAEVTHQDQSVIGLTFRYQGEDDFRKIRQLWGRHHEGEDLPG